jgi:hypothetical protein
MNTATTLESSPAQKKRHRHDTGTRDEKTEPKRQIAISADDAKMSGLRWRLSGLRLEHCLKGR